MIFFATLKKLNKGLVKGVIKVIRLLNRNLVILYIFQLKDSNYTCITSKKIQSIAIISSSL